MYSLDSSEYKKIFPRNFLNKNNCLFVMTGIPKSGSNLLKKILSLLTGKLSCGHSELHEWISDFTEQDLTIWLDHLYDTNEYIINYLKGLKNKSCFDHLINNYKTILLLRDPRDRDISSLCFYQNGQKFLEDPDIEKLKKKGKDKPFSQNLLREYFYYPNILKIRFEDLVGEKGGGSSEKQSQAILDIANFLNIQLSDEQLHYVCENLYGNSPTFRKGTIGQWKLYFDEELKEIYKETHGQLLIDLGYEKDFNW